MAHYLHKDKRDQSRTLESRDYRAEREEQRQTAEYRQRREALQSRMEDYINSYYE